MKRDSERKMPCMGMNPGSDSSSSGDGDIYVMLLKEKEDPRDKSIYCKSGLENPLRIYISEK